MDGTSKDDFSVVLFDDNENKAHSCKVKFETIDNRLSFDDEKNLSFSLFMKNFLILKINRNFSNTKQNIQILIKEENGGS